MGRVVALAELSGQASGNVKRAPITSGETSHMSAEFVSIDPDGIWAEAAPTGSDCYLFALDDGATIVVNGQTHSLAAQTFATVEEGTRFRITNAGTSPARMVMVLAPPPNEGQNRALAGFKGGLAVAERGKTEVVAVPEQRKKRIYFVRGHGVPSGRGHAMIVVYDGQTNTPLHYHPNADSMFVLLDGAVEFTVNGEQIVVRPGQAAYFPTNDRHGLHTAPGHSGASFLEFHIPAGFQTVML